MEQPPLESGPLVVLASGWSEGGCHLRVRRPGHDSFLVPVAGLALNYRADPDSPRHCVGHQSPKRNEGRYVECHNRPQPGNKTCVSCAVADAEFAADLHHAHTRPTEDLHESVVQHLQRANVLYLASFRDGSVKVGTSTGSRRHTRLVEQGAWLAVEAASVADGFEVRRLEDLVTERLGLPQSVATTRKLRGMVNPRSDQELTTIVERNLDRVHDLMIDAEGAAAAESATPTSQWWRFPDAEEPWWAGAIAYPTPLTAGNHQLELQGACGRVVAFGRPGQPDRFVDDIGQLYGRELDLGRFEPDPLLIQDSLF